MNERTVRQLARAGFRLDQCQLRDDNFDKKVQVISVFYLQLVSHCSDHGGPFSQISSLI